VAALFLIVIVVLVVMAMARMTLVQHGTNSLSVQQARAYQAARAGIEWGLSRAVHADVCAAGSLAFTGSNLSEFSVVVSCTPNGYTDVDGEPVTLYRFESIAQNGVAGSRPDYAYRRLSAVVER
jgi:MSHA biogenesis protein MshP